MADMRGRAGSLPADVEAFRQLIVEIADSLPPPIRGHREITQEPDGARLCKSTFHINDTIPIYREGKPVAYQRTCLLRISVHGLAKQPREREIACWTLDPDGDVDLVATECKLDKYALSEFGALCIWRFGQNG